MIWLDGMGVIVAIAAGASGAVWALYQLGSRINVALRRQDSIDRLLTREMNGADGSLKSQVTDLLREHRSDLEHVKAELDLAKRERSFLQHTVDLHIADVVLHQYDPDAHRRDAGPPDSGGAGPR